MEDKKRNKRKITYKNESNTDSNKENITKDLNKTQILGIRVEDELIKKLEIYALNTKETKSQIARRAIVEWMDVLDHSRKVNQIIISKELFKKCLDLADETSIQLFAKETVMNFDPRILNITFSKESPEIIEMVLQYIIKTIGAAGQGWFQHLEYSFLSKNLLEISGIHNLNLNFARYFKYFLLTIFKLGIHSESLTENQFKLSFLLE